MVNFIKQIFTNEVLMTAFIAWFVAQFIKAVNFIIVKRSFSLAPFFSSGGMPSAHTAMVTSIAVAIGERSGWNSPLFALSVVFALVVMYDAAGVRRAAGKQAELLNQMVNDIYHHRNGNTQEKLKELLGHTPVEVVAGAILGTIIALVL